MSVEKLAKAKHLRILVVVLVILLLIWLASFLDCGMAPPAY